MCRLSLLLLCLLATTLSAADTDKKNFPKNEEFKRVNDKIKEVAGTAEFLRSVPKHFATLKAVDVAGRRVTLLIEGEKLPKVWTVAPDAEIKIDGWWGRLDQFTVGDRVWAWFQTDRKKQAVAVAMLADEMSEQDIHGGGSTLLRRDDKGITIQTVKKTERTLQTKVAAALPVGKPIFLQSSGNKARLALDPAGFEARRTAQKAVLCKRWIDEGLPGTVTFLHRFSGEMEVMLDHEAMRWGRSLKLGDKVTLAAQPPMRAIVKDVRPWRERTQLRLVVNSFDQTELSLGQRIHLKLPAPSEEVDAAKFPPDLDRPRSKEERVEWFLASIYCSCGVAGDVCTGHFYTLASCNPNGCGMPRHMRQIIAEEIDKGKTDKQIFEVLLKDHGPDLLRPHLAP
ncbi:MAG TPA: hypothetical protein VH643_12235 [Gemmataceae bacterium]|jgi:hypothetical protein